MQNSCMASSAQTNFTVMGDKIIVFTFKLSSDNSDEISVMIENPLTGASSIEEVMDTGDVFGEVRKESRFKIRIKTKSGHKLTFKWNKF